MAEKKIGRNKKGCEIYRARNGGGSRQRVHTGRKVRALTITGVIGGIPLPGEMSLLQGKGGKARKRAPNVKALALDYLNQLRLQDAISGTGGD